MSDIKLTLRAYLRAFPRVEDDSVVAFLAFPYCHWADGQLLPCPDPTAFLAFRNAYMRKVDPQVVASEILAVEVAPLGPGGAFVNLRTSRRNREGVQVSEGVTGFVLVRIDNEWRMTASVQRT